MTDKGTERRLNEFEQRLQKLEEKMSLGTVIVPAHVVDEKSRGELSATTTAEDDTPGFGIPVTTKGV